MIEFHTKNIQNLYIKAMKRVLHFHFSENVFAWFKRDFLSIGRNIVDIYKSCIVVHFFLLRLE